jgi:hypothetical protein
MSRRRLPRPRVASLAVWGVVALVVWLDAHGPHVSAHAAFLGFLLSAISWIIGAFQTVGSAVATALSAVVSYLVTAVSWLTGRLASVITSSGTIFAKTWDGLRRVWTNVLRPVILWTDKAFTRVETWLTRTFGPAFKYLRLVRNTLDHVFTRFLRPVFDTVSFVRQFNRVLHVVHIHVLDGVTSTLMSIEQRLDAALFFLYGKINELTNWINVIVTADGLFQQVTLLRSLERDLVYSWRMMVNARDAPLTAEDRAFLAARNQPPTFQTMNQQFEEYATSGTGPMADAVAAIDQAVADAGL